MKTVATVFLFLFLAAGGAHAQQPQVVIVTPEENAQTAAGVNVEGSAWDWDNLFWWAYDTEGNEVAQGLPEGYKPTAQFWFYADFSHLPGTWWVRIKVKAVKHVPRVPGPGTDVLEAYDEVWVEVWNP